MKKRSSLTEFKITKIDRVKKDNGIYAFWYRERCMYVGKAKDQTLYERLYQHYKRSHNKRLRQRISILQSKLQFCFLVLPKRKIDYLEKKFIQRLQPQDNNKRDKA